MMSRDRFRDYSAPMTALEVVTLIIAQARYGLSVAQARLVEDLLHGKQRRLVSGLTGYYVQDIEAAIREMERS